MAVRAISGVCLNGQLLAGFFSGCSAGPLRSVGDVFADTVVLYDPDGFWRYPGLCLRPAARRGQVIMLR